MAVEAGWKAELRSAEVLKDLKLGSLPIDPFEIAARKDILCQANSSLGSGISGCMMKVGDNFGIVYSTRFPSEGFQRFTVAHELGHYFMDGHISHLFANGQRRLGHNLVCWHKHPRAFAEIIRGHGC